MGVEPAAIRQTPRHIPVLDWCLQAFSLLTPDVHFVGGYLIEAVKQRYPHLQFSYNPEWSSTGATASLLCAPLTAGRMHYVCYGDIVFEATTVTELAATDGDIVMVVDGAYWDRAKSFRHRDAAQLEKVINIGRRVEAVGRAVSTDRATSLFVGLVRLSPRAVDVVRDLRHSAGRDHLQWTFSTLLGHLQTLGLTTQALDIGARWATFDRPQDVARFVVGGKADTLKRLQPLVKRAHILDQVVISDSDWLRDRTTELDRVARTFPNQPIIVRSSSRSEDGWTASNAGRFLSVQNVASGDPVELARAISSVVASFGADKESNVLIQPMLSGILAAGVALTRTLRHGGPYYVVNYDDVTAKIDSVTSGTGRSLKKLVCYRGRATQSLIPSPLENLLPALRELEELVGFDSIDVEFAVDRSRKIWILQLRPIIGDYSKWKSSDTQTESLLTGLEKALAERAPPPFQLGSSPAYGVMPDWNPAEMIGTRPRRLALSLYQYLLTNNVWAKQRAELGYRDVRPYALIKSFAGQPYVDVRASFNSFVPAGLSEPLAEKLINYYVSELRSKPFLHDKIEFEVAFTCLTFGFNRKTGRLRRAGFEQGEIDQLTTALRGINRKAAATAPEHLRSIAALARTRAQLAGISDPITRCFALLESCRELGTLPFAHLARQAFIATTLLRGLVDENILTADDFRTFQRSVRTVAVEFTEDAADANAGKLPIETMIARYGHLRPGTYEITSPSYKENRQYLLTGDIGAKRQTPKPTFTWPIGARKRTVDLLQEVGLDHDIGAFEDFLRAALEGRERAKFEFSWNVSLAIDAIAAFAERNGLTREDMSHVSIDALNEIRKELAPSDPAWIARRAQEGREAYSATQAIELPPLIFSSDDLYCFLQGEDQPNFIGSGRAYGEAVELSAVHLKSPPDLAGRIAIIQSADPGYDWLFLHNIAAFITVYGGANSHMAIRAAEFGLPAAIGVGSVTYERIKLANHLMIDCDTRQLIVID
jgi:choline kinase/phosphohistidine swiveling domain-containing protein